MIDQDQRILRKRRQRQEKIKLKRRKNIRTFILMVLLAIAVVFLVNNYLYSLITVDGNSMQDTLNDGDRLFVKKIGLSADDLETDDLIYFKGIDDRYYVKRVIGTPGQVIEIINGHVFVNGVQKQEEYINEDFTETYDQNKWTLGPNQFFVLGDNRYKDLSKDSRLFGPINFEQIEGKIISNF